MAWSTNTDKAALGNQGKGNPLPEGKFDYKITAAGEVADKKDLSGKRKQTVIEFSRNGTAHNVYFSPESENDIVAEIAISQLGSIGRAAGLKGVLKPERLKTLVGKEVSLDVYTNKKGYPAIGGIDVVSGSEKEEETESEEPESEEGEEEEKNPWE